MKKNFCCMIAAVLLSCGFSTSVAAAGYYVGIQGGAGIVSDTEGSDSEGRANFRYDTGYDGSITLGYDLGAEHPKIGKGRVELEFNKASNDIKDAEFVEGKSEVSGSAKRTSIMLNTIGEYTTQSGIIIYALLGLGWAEISLDNVSIMGGELFVDDSNSQLAYQLGFGFGRRLSEHLTVDIGYRFYGTTSQDFTKEDGTRLDFEYASHRVVAGLRLNF